MLVRLGVLAGVVGEVLVRGQQGLDGEGWGDWRDAPHTAPTHLVKSDLNFIFTVDL